MKRSIQQRAEIIQRQRAETKTIFWTLFLVSVAFLPVGLLLTGGVFLYGFMQATCGYKEAKRSGHAKLIASVVNFGMCVGIALFLFWLMNHI